MDPPPTTMTVPFGGPTFVGPEGLAGRNGV
jgi:hypothetical protein